MRWARAVRDEYHPLFDGPKALVPKGLGHIRPDEGVSIGPDRRVWEPALLARPVMGFQASIRTATN